MEPCWIRSNQIEAARVAMTRYVKRGVKVWIKIFPDKPVTHKPLETRMGLSLIHISMCIRDRRTGICRPVRMDAKTYQIRNKERKRRFLKIVRKKIQYFQNTSCTLWKCPVDVYKRQAHGQALEYQIP